MLKNKKPVLTHGVRLRSNQYWTEYVVISPTSGYYPIGHPRFGQQYTTEEKRVISDSRGDIGFTADLDVVEVLTSPRYHGSICIVWPGKEIYGLPPGQVRNFGSSMTDWETEELDKIITEMKKEQGLLDIEGNEIEEEEAFVDVAPSLTPKGKKIKTRVVSV